VLSLNDRNEVALLRQPDVSERHWVLVAGFNKAGETVEETVIREVREETGLVVKECRYIASYYRSDKNLLLMGFLTYVDGTLSKASPEVDDVRWVPAILESSPNFVVFLSKDRYDELRRELAEEMIKELIISIRSIVQELPGLSFDGKLLTAPDSYANITAPHLDYALIEA